MWFLLTVSDDQTLASWRIRKQIGSPKWQLRNEGGVPCSVRLVTLGAPLCNPLHAPHLHKPILPPAGNGLARSKLHIHDFTLSMIVKCQTWKHWGLASLYFSQSLKELTLENVISSPWTPVSHQPLWYGYFRSRRQPLGGAEGWGNGWHHLRHRGLKGRTSVWREDRNQWAVDSIHSNITSAQGFMLQDRKNIFKTSGRDGQSKFDWTFEKQKWISKKQREAKNKTKLRYC